MAPWDSLIDQDPEEHAELRDRVEFLPLPCQIKHIGQRKGDAHDPEAAM